MFLVGVWNAPAFDLVRAGVVGARFFDLDLHFLSLLGALELDASTG